MSEQTEIAANKAVVQAFFAAFSESRFQDALDHMDDEGSWWVSGSTEISGTYSKAEFLALASSVAGGTKAGIRLMPTGLIGEANKVAAEAVSDGETLDGKRYENKYHFLFEFKQAKFIAVREYMDPMHVRDVFGV